jgi:hypothetical protein
MVESTHQDWSNARRFTAGVGATAAAAIWVQAVAYLLRTLSPDSPLAAVEWTVAAVVAVAVGTSLQPGRWAARAAALVGGIGTILIEVMIPGSWPGALAVPAVAVAATWGGGWLGRRLPEDIDTVLERRKIIALIWAVVALIAVIQTARLSAFVADREIDFVVGTTNPFWFKHECLPAYLYAAELSERGVENVYDRAHYPALNPEATPESRMTGMVVEDPFQYPPQFLLLPRLAIALTDDAGLVRVVWFAIQATFFVGAFAALALWVGGAAGRTALWLLPAAFASFPMLYDFQYGQFHLATIAVAMLGLVAIERRWLALGGFLLSGAVMVKLFPALLVVMLAAQRKWRALAWTAGWGIAITLLAVAVLGTAPFAAFFTHQLPQLASGAAFAFDEVWPDMADFVVADNQGVFGLMVKLGVSKPAAASVARGFGLLLLLLAFLAGRRLGGASRWTEAVVALGLLGLGSLTSNGAWGDYVPTTAIWLLALVAAPVRVRARWAIPVAAIAVFQYFLIGTMPVGEWFQPGILIPASAVGVLGLLVLFGGAVVPAWDERLRTAES